MSRELHFNAFWMASPAQSWAGLWSHPSSNGANYNTLSFWTDLARQAEAGLLDGIFLADALGVPDVYAGRPDAVIQSGAMFPSNDPMMVVSAMAAVTKHLCFGITGNTTYEPPYLLARRFSTLDHLSSGRVAWNIVTGILASTAKAMGLKDIVAHDARYDVADQYMDLVYKLWEESWDDGAAVRDRQSQTFADPAKVRPVSYQSSRFACEGIHLSEPSPQRTPLLFAAGASKRGAAFAGRHAECAFMSTNNLEFAKRSAAAFRDAAVRDGRSPTDIKIFNAATVIVGATEIEAKEKLEEYKRYSHVAGNLAIMSMLTGIDLSMYSLDDELDCVESNAIQSIVASIRFSAATRRVTLREFAQVGDAAGREAFIIGSADQVCEELLRWRDEADIDGFNLVRTVEPDGLQSFIDFVVPGLQERGAYKTAYRAGTMRDQLFPGNGPRLSASHYGSRGPRDHYARSTAGRAAGP